jgi:NAD(P)-dependent dehydrogenase (short-subunit alcohol dehydrogenase family)
MSALAGPDHRRAATVLVAGGTGQVGRYVVPALRQAGATVIVPSRRAERVRALYGADVVAFELDIATEAGCDELLRRLTGVRLDGVVIALGGWWTGPSLSALDPVRWRDLVDSHLTTHFHVIRAAWASLADESAVVSLNGIAGLRPIPGSGPVSVAGAAQQRMLEVLAAEAAPGGPAIHTLYVLADVADAEAADAVAGSRVGACVASLLKDRRSGLRRHFLRPSP